MSHQRLAAKTGVSGLDGTDLSRHAGANRQKSLPAYDPQVAGCCSMEKMMLQTNKSKNDPTARGTGGEGKTFDGKKVKPVLYVGTAIGHGRYIAVQDEGGKMIMDKDGKPVAFRDV
ncbi:MAG: hypothetical protein AAGA21_24450 [Pseudomonadota bacterium]